MQNYLIHWGILGQKWGKRNYQYEDGSLTPEGRDHYGVGPPRSELAKKLADPNVHKINMKKIRKKDDKWLRKQDRTTRVKLQKQTQKSKEMRKYDKALRKVSKVYNSDGSLNKNYVANYNIALAEIMNRKVADLEKYSPSGMTLQFVAKRGDIGVYAAMATPGYDMSQVRRGVNSEGKVAYKKQYIDQVKERD